MAFPLTLSIGPDTADLRSDSSEIALESYALRVKSCLMARYERSRIAWTVFGGTRLTTCGTSSCTVNERMITTVTAMKLVRICPVHPLKRTVIAAAAVTSDKRIRPGRIH